jgi:hypothetical protein
VCRCRSIGIASASVRMCDALFRGCIEETMREGEVGRVREGG